MTLIVVDASITAAILFDDEVTTHDGTVSGALRDGELAVPAHWSVELVSLLLKAERRGRMTRQRRNEHLGSATTLLARARIEPASLLRNILDLVTEAGLTGYDAGYLELAIRLGAMLATNDDALIAAACARGVPVLTTRS